WCPHCAKCFKLNIGIAKEIAFKKGGICLFEKYINSYTPLFWQCAKKHEWQAPLERIRNHNSWCPKCVVDTRRVGLDLAKNIARSKNGECLSDKYINIHTLLQWRCHQGHIWHAVLNTIKNQNSWCPQCAGCSKLNINIAKEIALKKGGKCLSEKYIDINSSLLWECNAKLSVEEARKIATKNKGLCLSEMYTGAYTKLKWQCEKKHEWYATLDKVKNLDLCKKIATKLLGPPSDIRRPDFLKTPDHPLGLELDIYYPQYGFAIEVQDQLKKELCNKNKIVLIEIWYYENLYLVIFQQFQKLGLIHPNTELPPQWVLT
ncbi:4952_t:CDS:2, partial [Racocetra fulgida]